MYALCGDQVGPGPVRCRCIIECEPGDCSFQNCPIPKRVLVANEHESAGDLAPNGSTRRTERRTSVELGTRQLHETSKTQEVRRRYVHLDVGRIAAPARAIRIRICR